MAIIRLRRLYECSEYGRWIKKPSLKGLVCLHPAIKAIAAVNIFFLLSGIPARAALNDPFPTGYSQLNFGTILQSGCISGRQPWIPACFTYDTTIRFSLSSAYVNYYDAMDNLSSSDFRQAAVGFLLPFKGIHFKGAGIFFNALGIYGETIPRRNNSNGISRKDVWYFRVFFVSGEQLFIPGNKEISFRVWV